MENNYQRRKFIKNAALAGLSVGLLNKFSFAGNLSPLTINRTANGKRAGIIGLDTSHAIAFTNSLNDPQAGNKYKGYKIVAAYPHGSSEIKSSYERIPAYTEQVKAKGVEIVSSIPDLLSKVDVVFLETNDGRLHKEQAFQVINAGKTVFIDKPIANSYKDALAIFNLAKQKNVPVFSSSSLRFRPSVQEIVKGKVGNVLGADVFSPSPLEKTHIDFFWYGIHGVEMLIAMMGVGCETVTRYYRENMDLVVGTWKDGRIGTFRGLRTPKTGYGGNIFGDKDYAALGDGYSNDDILLRIIDFFETGNTPVPAEQTLEICRFIEASQLSRKRQGKSVKLSEIK